MEHATLMTPQADKKNWCFEEYNAFSDSSAHLKEMTGQEYGKRYHFIITADQLANLIPAVPDPNYSSWFTRVEGIHCKTLYNKKYGEAREAIQEIAFVIAKLRKEAIADLLK
jgi:hypothetical protein